MSENIITTKRCVYGRVNVTLPLPIKTNMLAWAKKLGMKKSEFLRMALTTGYLELSKGILACDSEMVGKTDEGESAVRPLADGQPFPSSGRGLSVLNKK